MFKRNQYKNQEVPSESGILVINNEVMNNQNVTINFKKNANYADLPLTEVLKALEFDVEWVDNNTADITYKDMKYILNLSEVSLMEDGDTFNLLLPPPGGKRTFTILNREIILDSTTMLSTLQGMEKNVNICIDTDELKVYITNRTE